MLLNWKLLAKTLVIGAAVLVTAPAIAGQKIYTGWFSDVHQGL